jgi:hypothetical protein
MSTSRGRFSLLTWSVKRVVSLTFSSRNFLDETSSLLSPAAIICYILLDTNTLVKYIVDRPENFSDNCTDIIKACYALV